MKENIEWMAAAVMFFAMAVTCLIFEVMMLIEGKLAGGLFLFFSVGAFVMFCKFGVKAVKRLKNENR